MYANSNLVMRPPYLDPETNIRYDTNDSEHEGWLTKQSMWVKDWRRRYFILKGSKLFFSKSPLEVPHGMIDLAHCTTVKSANLKSHKVNSFEISTPDRTYLLYADTEKEKDDWIGCVGRSIVRCSSTYVHGEEEAKQNNKYINNDDDEDNDDPTTDIYYYK